MNDSERQDLLLDQTAQEILGEVFDVEHVFPAEFLKEEEKSDEPVRNRSWSPWRWLASCLGFRKRTEAAVLDEQ